KGTAMTRSGLRSMTAVLAAGATALALAACSGGNGGETATGTGTGAEPADTDEPVELHIAWWGNDERAALMAEAIDLFEAQYPNITVVEEPVGAPDDLFNR